MPRYRTAYPPEFRRKMVDLVRSGRTPEELAREFEPTAQSISTWVKQADRDAGKRSDGPTSVEREELGRLRRENHRLRQERDIWQRRRPGSRGRARRARTGLPVHERAQGPVSHSHNGPRPEGFGLGLLRLAEPTRFGSGDRRRRSDASYPHDPRWIAWNLWPATRLRPKLQADGLFVVPQADSSADAGGRDRGRQPAQKRAGHGAAGEGPPFRQRSRPPQLRPSGQTAVGGRHHLPAHVGRLSYLAVVLDDWSRRIIGWAFSADLKFPVVLDAGGSEGIGPGPDVFEPSL